MKVTIIYLQQGQLVYNVRVQRLASRQGITGVTQAVVSYKLPEQLPCPEAEINSKSRLFLTESLEMIALFLSESHSYNLGVHIASALHQRLGCIPCISPSHMMTAWPEHITLDVPFIN